MYNIITTDPKKVIKKPKSTTVTMDGKCDSDMVVSQLSHVTSTACTSLNIYINKCNFTIYTFYMQLAETKRKEKNQIIHKPSHCEILLDESDSDNDSKLYVVEGSFYSINCYLIIIVR